MDLAGKQAGAGPPERLNVSVSRDWESRYTRRLPAGTRREQSNHVSPNGLCHCQHRAFADKIFRVFFILFCAFIYSLIFFFFFRMQDVFFSFRETLIHN